jgi:hypothetical protein
MKGKKRSRLKRPENLPGFLTKLREARLPITHFGAWRTRVAASHLLLHFSFQNPFTHA